MGCISRIGICELYLIEIWKIRDFISENRYDGWRLL